MLILVKKIDKTYGGYDYLEVDTVRKVYSTGVSRAHAGHGSRHYTGGEGMDIIAPTLRVLNDQVAAIEHQGYTKVENMWKYHRSLEQE